MRGQRGGIEGRDAAPGEGDAALAQEGVGLVPQAREAEAAAVRRGQVDVEVPGSLARRREPVATAYLVLLRSEEHTSELQSLMRISYAVFCLKKKKKRNKRQPSSN